MSQHSSSSEFSSSEQLRQTFAAQLPRRIEEIVRQVRELEVEVWNPRRVDLLHRLVFSLSSSARSFDLQTVAEVAKPLEVNLARLLGRLQQPKHQELQRISEAMDELVRVARTCYVNQEPLPVDSVAAAESELVVPLMVPHIYLARDVPEQAHALQQILHDAHYRVEVFTELDSLIEACQQQWPNLILLDMVQIEQEAALLKTLQHLRAQGPAQMQLLVLSSQRDVPSRLAYYRAGAHHCLSRPLQTAQLLALLGQLCGRTADRANQILLISANRARGQEQALLLQDAGILVQVVHEVEQVALVLEKFEADVIVLDAAQEQSSLPAMELAQFLRDLDPHSTILFQGQESRSLPDGEEFLPDDPAKWINVLQSRAARARHLRHLAHSLDQERQLRAREQEAMYAHAIVSISDASGIIQFVNDKFCRISGYSRAELIGRNHSILKSGQHTAEFYQDMWRTISHGHMWHGEICNRNKDGGLYWLDTSITPFLDEHGRPWQYLAVRTEVSAYKEQEKVISQAQRKEKLAHWEDEPGLQWSDLMHDVFGSDQELMRAGHQLFDGASEAEVGSGEQLQITHRVLRADGQIRYVRESGRCSIDAQGRLARNPGSVRDITLEKGGGQNLTRGTIEAMLHAKSTFLSSLSQQLKLPLNAILACQQLAQSEGEYANALQQGGQEIAKAGQHLLALVSDVLDLARLEADKLEVRLEPVSLQHLFLVCEAHSVALAAAHEIHLHFDLGAAQKLQVLADAVRLRQILLGLISNAIKYNRPHGKVNISCATQGARLRIQVADTGYGISAEKMARLFTPFDRVGEDAGRVSGTGLGLVISRACMHLMRGQIGVESTPGLGAIFWLELPLLRPPGLSPPATTAMPGWQWMSAPAPVLSGGSGPAGSGGAQVEISVEEEQMNLERSSDAVAQKKRRLVLYIEDNPASQRLMHKVLAKRGDLEMIDAISAEVGLPLAQSLLPVLVLLDINLPGLDGYEALAKLRAMPGLEQVPVVAVTANAMKGDAERGLAAGFTAYVAKPLDIEQFYALLDRLIGAAE